MDPTTVRVYDLGGFGDIAGAMRVASHLHRVGHSVKLSPKSASAHQKLMILQPDVDYSDAPAELKESIEVDVAGHYRDPRSPQNLATVPHHFTEDMDNSENRRYEVPIYLKTGFVPRLERRVPGGHKHPAPLFYRPYREWDLPKPAERDVRRAIVEAMFPKTKLTSWDEINRLLNEPLFNLFSLSRITLGRKLEKLDHIAFAHLSPPLQSSPPEVILEHPYFYAVHTAKVHGSENYAIGLFVGKEVEQGLTRVARQKYWNVISSDGSSPFAWDFSLPAMIFLGPQPQTRTTALFLSATMPNLVTGDLSLSDALYGLLAMEGPGFFYEAPGWKIPTLKELVNLLAREGGQGLGNDFFAGSQFLNVAPEIKALHQLHLARVVSIFADPAHARDYTAGMRNALRDKIRRRYGDTPTEPSDKGDFYIPPGTPWLIQDATAAVVEALHGDDALREDVERARKAIRQGTRMMEDARGVLKLEATPIPSRRDTFDFLQMDYLSYFASLEKSGLYTCNLGQLIAPPNSYNPYKLGQVIASPQFGSCPGNSLEEKII